MKLRIFSLLQVGENWYLFMSLVFIDELKLAVRVTLAIFGNMN